MAAKAEIRLPKNELDGRFRELGVAAAARLVKEMEPGGGALYDMVEDADVVQLISPEVRTERWEVRMARYGDEIEVVQMFFGQAGKSWQVGEVFYFSHEEIAKGGDPDQFRSEEQEAMMSDYEFFHGLVEAMKSWPVAVERIIPLGEVLIVTRGK